MAESKKRILTPEQREALVQRFREGKAKSAPSQQGMRVFNKAVEDLPGDMKSPIPLPYYKKPLTTGKMTPFWRRLGLTNDQFKTWTGFRMAEYVLANPLLSLRAWAVLVIENLEHIKEA